MVGNLFSDIRYCLRGFARRPLFAVVIVVTLALGLEHQRGDLLDLRSGTAARVACAEPAPARESRRRPGTKQGDSSSNDGGTQQEIFSFPMFRDLERVDGPFVGIAAHRIVDANLAFDGKTVAAEGCSCPAAISRCSVFARSPAACSMPATIASKGRRAPSC